MIKLCFSFVNSHRLLILSMCLGTLIGVSNVFSAQSFGFNDIPLGGWKCPLNSVSAGNETCTSTGCTKKGGQDGYWVCTWSGNNCPTLEACVSSGDS